MHHLRYHTVTSERHTAVVSTWQQGDDLCYRFRLDGRVLDEGVVGPAPEDEDDGDE